MYKYEEAIDIEMENTTITTRNEYKYLEVIFNTTGTADNEEIRFRISKAKRIIGALKRI